MSRRRWYAALLAFSVGGGTAAAMYAAENPFRDFQNPRILNVEIDGGLVTVTFRDEFGDKQTATTLSPIATKIANANKGEVVGRITVNKFSNRIEDIVPKPRG